MHYTNRLILMVFAVLGSITVFAQDVTFTRVNVVNGPMLEYPSHWKLAEEGTVQNRAHATQASAEAAGVDMSGFQKRNRVIIESTPTPSTGQIRASIVTPQEYSQDDLRVITSEDLRQFRIEFEAGFKKLSVSSAVKLAQMGEPRIERVGDRLALVIPYTRFTEYDKVLWKVEQYKIPFEDRLLSLTLSYKTSDGVAMKPILDRVKRTMKF